MMNTITDLDYAIWSYRYDKFKISSLFKHIDKKFGLYRKNQVYFIVYSDLGAGNVPSNNRSRFEIFPNYKF